MSIDLDVDEWGVVREAAGVVDMEALAASVKPRPREPDPPPTPPPPLHWPTLPDFVTHLVSWYRMEVFASNDLVWCPEWWQHPWAVIAVESMWTALEALRQDEAVGISTWLRDHAYVHMAKLMDPAGPFRGCHAVRGHATDPLEPLPIVDPPEGWWTPGDSGL